MEAKHLNRLREEQDKAIVETDENIAQWEEMKNNYLSLQERLKTLSHKVSHDVMVPFGPYAFMPGKLIHTNEITVLLGDNWFVERSSKQAAEIAGRRVQSIEKSIKGLNEQKKLLQPRVDITSELQNIAKEKDGLKEIVEPYDPEEDRLWREKHKKSVQAHKKKLREEREKEELKPEEKKELTDEEIWAKLTELEELEESRQDRLKPEKDLNLPISQTDPKPHHDKTQSKHIHWKDKDNSDNSYDEESTDDGDDDGDNVDGDDKIQKNKITFSHSLESLSIQGTSEGSDESNGNISPTITSPRDIYKLFGHVIEPKSILKKASKKQSVRKAREAEIEETRTTSKSNVKKMSDKAFTGAITEKSTTSSSQPPVTMPTPVSKSVESKRPVSKFRASRQKQTES